MVNTDSPFFGRLRYGDFTHEVAFTAASISQVLRAAGFTDVRCYLQSPVIHGVPSLSRWLIWQAIRVLLHLYLAAETGQVRGHILTQNLIAVARKPSGREEMR